MTNHDIEAIERATLAAVAPPVVEEIDGWLLPFDDGVVGRAKSAVPLRHDAPELAPIDRIEARYAERSMPAIFRFPEVPSFQSARETLQLRGYVKGKPTLVQVAQASDVARISSAPAAELEPVADDEWASVFLGEGFDPVDGASRVQTLRRAQGSLFATVRDESGTAIAAGALALGHGWASIHGMRTAAAHRGRGHASRILATFAREAISRGFDRVVLQVEEGNPAAQLYQRCGFSTAWAYAYWRLP